MSSTTSKTPVDLSNWDPEDPERWDSRFAWRTLWITTYNLTLAFAVWFLVSAVAPRLNSIGYDLSDGQLYWLVAIPGLAGGFMRMIYMFLPPIVGTRTLVGGTATLLLLPMIGWTIAIRDPETADVLAGLLFAGLASTRRSGADRAAAWVTAAATPPSADPERLPQGVRLRGRSAKVAELLGHHDGGCVWVTLQPGVDIARGLARTPVTQPTLAGLVEWWRSTRTLPSVIESSTAATIADAVEAVRPQLDHTPWSEVVGRLHDALARCAERDESILVSIGIDAEATAHPGATGHAGATGPQTSVVVSDGPTRAARRS